MSKTKGRIATAVSALTVATSVVAISLLGGGAATAAEPKERQAVVQPSANTVGANELKTGAVGQTDMYAPWVKVLQTNWTDSVPRNAIQKDAVDASRLSPEVRADMAKGGPKGDVGPAGPVGPAGAVGAKGDSYLTGAYYSVAYYDKGNTNAGAIATAACKLETDTAISGGVSVDDYTMNTPVSQSFPGRMDWATNTPKPNRVDGWVVQFGGNAGAVSDKAPGKVKIYALCVPGLTVPVVQTYLDSEG